MANTIDADLLIDTLSDQVVTFLGARLAPLKAFSKDFSTDELVQAKAVQVPLITAGSTTLTNPSSFEAGDSVTSNIAVTVNHISQPFHITSQQYNQRFRIEQLAKGNLNTFANALSDVWTALVVAGNFGGAAHTGAQTAFAAASAKTMWANIGLSPEKYLLLDSVAYAQLAPDNKNSFQLGESGAYGFNGIYQQTRWTGALANTYGFACGPDAIAVAAGLPMQVPGLANEMVGQRNVTIEGLGLTVQVNSWVSRASRSLWASYDVMFGAAAGLDPAGGIIVSA